MPFVVSMDCGRVVVTTPDIASDLLVGHGPALTGFFLEAAVPQAPMSPPIAIGPPFDCEFVVIVCVEVVEPEDDEELDDRDEDELARWALFLGMNIRATSSGFIELWP